MPVLMPTTGIRRVESFEIETNDSINTTLGGSSYATEWGTPSWDISMSTTNLQHTGSRYREWRAFLDSLRGSKKLGYFYDPRRPFPANYPTGFAGMVKAGTAIPFTGAADITSFTNRYTVNVAELPANFALLKSDYVSFELGDLRSLHRIVTSITANSSGEATLVVEPRVPLVFTTSATPRFDRPSCMGLIVPKSIRDSADLESSQISFKARSIIIPGTAA